MKHKKTKLKFKNPYKLENELCDVFAAYAKTNGWKVYYETSGWDLLLVKGIQIGVQAKLKDNVDVLAQAIDGLSRHGLIDETYAHGPHIRAVLVPRASVQFRAVAAALKIFVIEGVTKQWDLKTLKQYWAKEIATPLDSYNKYYLHKPKEVAWVPEVQVNTPAGVKSPKIITEWKLKAVKLCLKLEKQGYLTSRDFTNANVSITLWKRKWLIASGKKDGKLERYVRRPNTKLPDNLYPEIVEAFSQKDKI